MNDHTITIPRPEGHRTAIPLFSPHKTVSAGVANLIVKASLANILVAPSALAAVSITGFFISPNPVLEGSSTALSISVSSTRILDGFNGSVTWGDSETSGAGGFSTATVGHAYADEGVYSISFSGTGFEHDFNGFFGSRRDFNNPISAGTTITVQNVAPTLITTPGDQTLDLSLSTEFSFSASATDPGTADVLTYNWDLDGDGQYDDLTGISGIFDYAGFQQGLYTLGVQVDDGDGGFDTQSFNLTIIPEPTSSTLMILAGLAIAFRRRRD